MIRITYEPAQGTHQGPQYRLVSCGKPVLSCTVDSIIYNLVFEEPIGFGKVILTDANLDIWLFKNKLLFYYISVTR